MKSKKTMLLVSALAFVVLALVCALVSVGNRSDGTTDTIELVEVSKWSQERVEKKLIGEYRGNILHSWGEPDAILTETSDKYYLDEDNSRYIILYYDNDDYIRDFVFGND